MRESAEPEDARPGAAGEAAHDGDRPPPAGPAAHTAERAAERVISSETIRVELPDGLGTVRLPSPKRLAFYGGIMALAVFGVVDWPVALLIGVGHLLAEDHHHRALEEFGEALAEA